jgi:hypothetical protein
MQPSRSPGAAAGWLALDTRYLSYLKLGLGGSLCSAVLFAAIGAIAAAIRMPTALFVLFALLLPACSVYGARYRAPRALAAFCCCSGFLGVLFVAGCISLFTLEKPRLACVCDAACEALPAARGPGNPAQNSDPAYLAMLRNSSLYTDLCARVPQVYSGMAAYAAVGVFGMIAQIIGCSALCYVRGKWAVEATSPLFLAAGDLDAPPVARILYNPHAAPFAGTVALAPAAPLIAVEGSAGAAALAQETSERAPLESAGADKAPAAP